MQHDPNSYDVAIVGAGSAGLAAAAVLGRCKRRVIIISEGERANSTSPEIHNVPYAEGVSPTEFYDSMTRDLSKFSCDIENAHVSRAHIDTTANAVRLETSTRTITAARLLLANGIEHIVPAWVPKGAWGKTVFTCPFCHAYEHSGEDFVIVGAGESAAEVALLCAAHARQLTVVISDPKALVSRAADRVRSLGGQVITATVQMSTMQSAGQLRLELDTNHILTAGAVILLGNARMRRGLSDDLGLAVNHVGIPIVDDDGRSSIAMVWVAGGAANPSRILAEAMSSGIRAAMSIHKALTLEGGH